MPDLYRPWVFHPFGAEFEMTTQSSNRTRISESMIRQTLMQSAVESYLNSRAAGYWHSDGHTWDVKTDSSCGWEISTRALVLNTEGHNEEMRSGLAALNAIDAVADRTCGTHVHIDTGPNYTWRHLQKLMILWTRYEPFFFELQPQSRRENSYCSCLRCTAWDRRPEYHFQQQVHPALVATSESRFERTSNNIGRWALNVAGWWRHRRIEVRLHAGTLNYDKIRHWIMLMTALVHRPMMAGAPEIRYMELPHPMQSLPTDYICKQLGLQRSRFFPDIPPEADALVQWLTTRRLQFTPGAGAGSPVLAAPATRVSPRPVARPAPRPVTERYLYPNDPEYVEPTAARIAPYWNRQAGMCRAEGLEVSICRNHFDTGNGRYLCAAHNEDYINNRRYRVIPPDPEQPPRGQNAALRSGDAGFVAPSALRLTPYRPGDNACSAAIDGASLHCQLPRYDNSALCQGHLEDYAANRAYRDFSPVDAPVVRAQSTGNGGFEEWSHQPREERCAARGMNCSLPRSGGRVFCAIHGEDYSNNRPYRPTVRFDGRPWRTEPVQVEPVVASTEDNDEPENYSLLNVDFQRTVRYRTLPDGRVEVVTEES